MANKSTAVLIPLIVAVAFMMEQLDTTAIVTALPAIARGFGRDVVSLNVAVTTYLISLAVFIPISGWVADRWGARRVFILSILIFTIASAGCGLSPDYEALILMRALQGLGGAMMTPVGRLILLRSFDKSELVRAMTYFTVPVVIGPTLGPLLGGIITNSLGWRWIFYLNIPLGLAGMACARLIFPADERHMVPRFDGIGFFLSGCTLVLLQFGIELLAEPPLLLIRVLLCVAAGAVFGGAYLLWMQGRPHAALDLRLLRIPTFRHGAVSGGISRIGMNSVPFLLPLMLQLGFGYSPMQSGFMTFIASFGTVFIRPFASLLLRKLGFSRLLAANSLLTALVIAGFVFFTARTPGWAILAYGLIFGIGRGLQFTTLNTVSFVDTPPEALSRSTSLSGVIQQLTMGLGISIGAAQLQLLMSFGLETVHAFHVVFLVMALFTGLSSLCFLRLHPCAGSAVSGYLLPPVRNGAGASLGR